jgi:WD40 repeat protein
MGCIFFKTGPVQGLLPTIKEAD